ncbi:MAG: GNAT family N-acetyltransferase [Clostridia bacterium]|nr:GNAT family N-acetyltransferase [Clostridia bacterium]
MTELTTNAVIREMKIEDYEQAISFWKSIEGMGLSDADSRENIAGFLNRNQGLSFVCEENGTLIGTLLCGHDGRRAFLYHLAVEPACRKRGIAGELIKRCFQRLEEEKIHKCHLFVFRNNDLGSSFWEGSGWQKREDLYVFSKTVEQEEL